MNGYQINSCGGGLFPAARGGGFLWGGKKFAISNFNYVRTYAFVALSLSKGLIRLGYWGIMRFLDKLEMTKSVILMTSA